VAQQLGQLSDIACDTPRFVSAKPLHRHLPAGLVLEIGIRERLSIGEDAKGFGGLLDTLRWREAARAGHHVSRVNSRPTSKITKAPGTTISNTNSNNGETWIIFTCDAHAPIACRPNLLPSRASPPEPPDS
jgi:hypothetical protein